MNEFKIFQNILNSDLLKNNFNEDRIIETKINNNFNEEIKIYENNYDKW